VVVQQTALTYRGAFFVNALLKLLLLPFAAYLTEQRVGKENTRRKEGDYCRVEESEVEGGGSEGKRKHMGKHAVEAVSMTERIRTMWAALQANRIWMPSLFIFAFRWYFVVVVVVVSCCCCFLLLLFLIDLLSLIFPKITLTLFVGLNKRVSLDVCRDALVLRAATALRRNLALRRHGRRWRRRRSRHVGVQQMLEKRPLAQVRTDFRI
jgi:hypothetical protein